MGGRTVSSTEPSASEDSRIERLPNYLSLAMLGERVLHLKRTATYEVVSRADFPCAVDMGGRHRLWVTAEVLAWIDRLPRQNIATSVSALSESRTVGRTYAADWRNQWRFLVCERPSRQAARRVCGDRLRHLAGASAARTAALTVKPRITFSSAGGRLQRPPETRGDFT